MIGIMKNKNLKEEIIAAMDEGFRHHGVLLEEMRDNINILIDGQEILHGRVDRLDGRMNRIEAKVDRLEVEVGSVNTKIDTIVHKMSDKAEKEEVIALEHRVTKLEA